MDVESYCDGVMRNVTASINAALGAELAKSKRPRVERVLFHPPATIVFWDDGVKTVVKCRECAGECLIANGTLRREGSALVGDMSQLDGDVRASLAQGMYCAAAYDEQKAVMAAMLKRLYPNFQDVLRKALGDEDV